MHDQSLEQKLRAALRTEGDSLAFTITAAELERRLAHRHRGRLSPMASLGLAAAVGVGLLGLVGVAGGWFEQRTAVVPPSPSPEASAFASPSASAGPSATPSGEVVRLLPSLDERVEAHDQALVVRAQAVGPADGPAATEQVGPRSVTFAPVSASGTYTVELSCLGPDQVGVEVTRGSNPEPFTDLGSFACTGEVTARRIDLEAGDHIRLRSDQPASWRVVVDAPAREAPRAAALGDLSRPVDDEVLLDASSPLQTPDYGGPGSGGAPWTPVAMGAVPQRERYRVLVTCAGPSPIRFAFRALIDPPPATPPEDHSVTQVECDGGVEMDVLELPLDDPAQVLVSADPRTAWLMFVTSDPPPITIAPDEDGWTISAGSGPNFFDDAQPGGLSVPGAEGGGDVRVVISCSGDTTITGTIDVGAVAGQKLDPFEIDCAPDGNTLARIYPDAAPYVEVLWDPHGARIWFVVSVQVRGPANPRP
jgi:hypothetical protein